MRRVLILALLCLALPASAAAQSSPFGPLPQPQAPAPTPEPVEPVSDGSLSRGVIFGIGGAILLAFVGIGVYISRDARSHLTEDDRRAIDRERDGIEPGARVRDERAKQKARARGKAQRQARKKQRR